MEKDRSGSAVARPKRVLLIRNAYVYDFGGAERLVVHIARELNLNHLEAIVVSRQPRLLAYAEAQGVTHRRGWWWSRQNWSGKRALLFPVYLVWQTILTAWYLQLLLRLKPDVVHALSRDDFIAGTLAARMLGKPVVWTDTADLKYVFGNHSVWYKNPVGKLVWLLSRLAGSILLVSRSEQRLIEAATDRPLPDRFQVMHLAGKDEKVAALARPAGDRSAVIFGSTSRLVAAKGIGELIEAFLQLDEQSDTYRLWLIGDGPDQARFEEQAHGNPHIRFVGHSEQPLAYLAACDVFMQPTHHEAFSLALAEAAMLGKPMIATEVGGNPELVNDKNGLLVPVRNSQALFKAMRTLGSDAALRHRLGTQARRDYVEKFDFARLIEERLVPLYG